MDTDPQSASPGEVINRMNRRLQEQVRVDLGETASPITAETPCFYCKATRECITCWHGRMLKEYGGDDE